MLSFVDNSTRTITLGNSGISLSSAKLAFPFPSLRHINKRTSEPSPPQCSFNLGRTIWFTWPTRISAMPLIQPWIAMRCMR